MKQQKGFTLIELIVVIVILGILAATALPRFANLQQDARMASANAALGALRAASGMSRAVFLARNVPAGGVQLIEGANATNTNGYPLAAEMAALAGLDAANYTITVAPPLLTVTPLGAPVATCSATYREAAVLGAAPIIATTPPVLAFGGC